MYIDLNIPVPVVSTGTVVASKKNKGKTSEKNQQAQGQQIAVTFTPAQLTAIESRIDTLEHLGYTVLAFNQTAQKKIDAKTHVNTVDPLLQKLRKRQNITYLKRLTILLDEDSEKGFGLTTGNLPLVAPYDLIALLPTTAATFSQACLSYTVPSNLTAHIISLPLTLPRLPFNLKHTLVRTAIKNGAVFEISYAGALGGDNDPAIGNAGGSDGGAGAKRNWWAAAREVVRVTKGVGIIVTSAVTNIADLRAPRDVGNLLSMLDLAQNRAHDASTKTAQSLILRAQTRKTYRAVFSEPKVVIPHGSTEHSPEDQVAHQPVASSFPTAVPEMESKATPPAPNATAHLTLPTASGSKKRPRADSEGSPQGQEESSNSAKKKIKNKQG